jgi:hypothetical protein
MMYATLAQFHRYVFDFYGRGGIYPMGATFDLIEQATQSLMNKLESEESEFVGDSIDRELVRDILISEYGLKMPPV